MNPKIKLLKQKVSVLCTDLLSYKNKKAQNKGGYIKIIKSRIKAKQKFCPVVKYT